MNNFYFDKSVGYMYYTPTKEDKKLAVELYHRDYRNNNLNSKTVYARAESRVAGLLGEIAYQRYMGDIAEYTGKGDCPYDYVIWNKDGSTYTVDIKTKYRKVPPKPNFEASLFEYQSSSHFGGVDQYVFLSTSGNFEKIWFCGSIAKNELMSSDKKVIWRAGDIDPTNNKVFHKDTISIYYKYLNQFQLLQ